MEDGRPLCHIVCMQAISSLYDPLLFGFHPIHSGPIIINTSVHSLRLDHNAVRYQLDSILREFNILNKEIATLRKVCTEEAMHASRVVTATSALCTYTLSM